jgi:hypothetical protein
MRKIIFITILTSFLSMSAWAKVQLDISVLVKRGLESGLVLTNEIHQVLLLSHTEVGQLRLKNGSKLEIGVQFLQEPKDYGPSSIVILRGMLKNLQGKVLGNFGDTNSVLHLGEQKTFIFREKSGQIVEVLVTPSVI